MMYTRRPKGHKMLKAIIAFALVFACTVGVEAKLFSFRPLDEPVVRRLPEEARDLYFETLEAIDRINYDKALRLANAAVEAAPQNIELRYIAINLATYRGEMSSGLEATQYFNVALEHVGAILQTTSLSVREQGRAEYVQKWLQRQRDTVAERDEGRRTYGLAVAVDYAKSIYTEENESAETKQFRDALAELASNPGSLSGAQRARRQAALAPSGGQEMVAAPGGAAAPAYDIPEGAQPSPFIPPIEGTRVGVGVDSGDFVDAKKYVDDVLPTFLRTWDVDFLLLHLDEAYINSIPFDMGADKTTPVRLMMSMLSQFMGPMTDYKGSEGSAEKIAAANGAVIDAKFEVNGTFANGDVPMYIQVVRVGGPDSPWKIRDLTADIAKVNQISDGQLAETIKQLAGESGMKGLGLGAATAPGAATGGPNPFAPGGAAPAPAAAPGAAAPGGDANPFGGANPPTAGDNSNPFQ